MDDELLLSENTPLLLLGYNVHIPYYLGNIFLGTVFYSLGHLATKQHDILVLKAITIGSFVLYMIQFLSPTFIAFHRNECSGIYFVAFAYLLASIYVFLFVFGTFFDKELPLLTHVGKYSIIYLVCHYPFLVCFFNLLNVNKFENLWQCFFLASMSCSIFLFSCDLLLRSKKLKWMVGL